MRADQEFESLLAEEKEVSDRKSGLVDKLDGCRLEARDCKLKVEHSEKMVEEKRKQVGQTFGGISTEAAFHKFNRMSSVLFCRDTLNRSQLNQSILGISSRSTPVSVSSCNSGPRLNSLLLLFN